MAWVPLRERLAALPLVLAGPILRRSEPSSVTVWVALKQPRSVTLEIYTTSGVQLFNGTAATLPIGRNFHLVAVTAQAPQPDTLSPGQTYLYDLHFGNAERLASPNVLAPASGADRVSYTPYNRPSFALPPAALGDLRIFHGSCRKPHGPGLDAMPALDTIIQQSLAELKPRPHQLFLTGDQIYADDVADALLYLLRDADSALLDWPEILPGNPDGKELLPGKRTPLTRRAGFTASLDDDGREAKSHLLTFGEYAMMYLFAWSEVLWPVEHDLPTFETVFSVAQGRADSDTERTRAKFEGETAALKTFSHDLPSVRRALANVPTYMIFDDHEITDDWFISLEWCKSVMAAPLGRRVIQNGMLAYALFQAWGNNPEHFKAGAGLDLLAAMRTFGGSNGSDEQARRSIAHRLGLPFDQVEADRFVVELDSRRQLTHIGDHPWHNGVSWHYQVARSSYEALVLDTRTCRAYPDRRRNGFPALISREGIQAQILSLAAPTGDMTVVISPAPFIGTPIGDMYQAGHIPVVDWIIKLFGGGASMRLNRDSEAWALDETAVERLLASLAQRATAAGGEHAFVLLGGDVHFGYTARLQYWAQQAFEATAATTNMIVAQLVASSFKNQAGATKFLHKIGYYPILDSLPATGELLGWDNPNQNGDALHIGKLSLAGIPLPLRWTTKAGNPAITHADDLIFGKILDQGMVPDWIYRTDYLLAEFELDEELEPANPDAPSTTDRIQALQSYLLAADDYDDYAERWGNGKEIVGMNNFGEIGFQWEANLARTAVHTLWWRLAKRDNDDELLEAAPLSRFVVPMDMNDPRYPKPPLD